MKERTNGSQYPSILMKERIRAFGHTLTPGRRARAAQRNFLKALTQDMPLLLSLDLGLGSGSSVTEEKSW